MDKRPIPKPGPKGLAVPIVRRTVSYPKEDATATAAPDAFGLAEFAQEWRETDAMADFSRIPNGVYAVEVRRVGLRRKEPDVYLDWVLQVVEGDHAGRQVRKSLPFRLGKTIRYLKHDLSTVGLGDVELQELPPRLQEARGRLVEVRVSGQENLPDVWFARGLSEEAGDNGPVDESPDDRGTL